MARLALHAEQDLGKEAWAYERCRVLGVPVPEVLVCKPAPDGPQPPYLILRRLAGMPARRAELTPHQRQKVLEDLGRFLALVHSVRLPGFGTLLATADGPAGPAAYAGRCTSLWEHLSADVERHLAALPEDALPRAWAAALRAGLERARPVLDRPTAVLVHGDYRFANVVLDGPRVSGIVDFENAVAGDPAEDLASLAFVEGRRAEDRTAIWAGYGDGADLADTAFQRRLAFYQIRLALIHLWWKWHFRDAAGIADVQARLRELEETLDAA